MWLKSAGDGGLRVGSSVRFSLNTRADANPPYASTILLIDLDIGDLAAGVLLPNVHHVVEPRDIALLVVAELADHGRELAAGLDGLGDLLRIERVCGFRRLLDDLHGGIAVQSV